MAEPFTNVVCVIWDVLRAWIILKRYWVRPLRWRQNGRDSVSIHQPHHCLLNRLFRRRSKKTSKLRVTGLCVGNSPGTGEFPAQMTSNAENVPLWWRHHDIHLILCFGMQYHVGTKHIHCWFHFACCCYFLPPPSCETTHSVLKLASQGNGK